MTRNRTTIEKEGTIPLDNGRNKPIEISILIESGLGGVTTRTIFCQYKTKDKQGYNSHYSLTKNYWGFDC